MQHPIKIENKGEPRKNTSFGFFVNFLPQLILEREGLYLSSYVMFQYSLYTIRRIKRIKFQQMSHIEMA